MTIDLLPTDRMISSKNLPASKRSVHLLQIALLTQHLFRPLRRVAGANRLLALRTVPLPQLPWIPQRDAFIMPLIRTLPRNGNVQIPIELQLLRNDLERLAGDRAPEDLLRDVVWDIVDGIRNLIRRTEVLVFRIVLPMPLPAMT